MGNLAAGVMNDLHFNAGNETVLLVWLTGGAGSVQQDVLCSPEILSSRLIQFPLKSNINPGQSAGVERDKEDIRIMEVDTISIRWIQLNHISVHFTHCSQGPGGEAFTSCEISDSLNPVSRSEAQCTILQCEGHNSKDYFWWFKGKIINAIIELVSSFQSSIADVLIPDCPIGIPSQCCLFEYEFLEITVIIF